MIQGGATIKPGYGPEALWEILPADASYIPSLRFKVGDTGTFTNHSLIAGNRVPDVELSACSPG